MAGDVFLLLHLLEPYVPCSGDLLAEFRVFYDYAGADCMLKWASYLRISSDTCWHRFHDRLAEALGVTDEHVVNAKDYLRSGEWSLMNVLAAIDEYLLQADQAMLPTLYGFLHLLQQTEQPTCAASSPLPVKLYLRSTHDTRPYDQGGLVRIRHAAMRPRLRRFPPHGADPILPAACRLCEASFPNQAALTAHWDCTHGGEERATNALLGFAEKQPYRVSAQEKRLTVEAMAHEKNTGTQKELEAYLPPPSLEHQKQWLWTAVFKRLAQSSLYSEAPQAWVSLSLSLSL